MYTLQTSDNNSIKIQQNDIIEPLDSDSTLPITLYGKNFREYGQQFQNNLYYILENFCGDTAPQHPVIGMLWYDNKNDMLKLYTGKTKPDGPWMQVAYEDMPSVTSTTTPAPLPPGIIAINYNTIKFGVTWGGNVDLDTVIVGYGSTGLCEMYRTVTGATFGSFTGLTYNGDVRLGGVEESYDINLTIVPYDTILLGMLEYTDDSFSQMTSLNTRIVNTTVTPNIDIANFTLNTITKDASNTPNTTYIIGAFTRTPSGWTYKSQQKILNSKTGVKAAFSLNDTLASLGLT
jgi:hypothetical protein